MKHSKPQHARLFQESQHQQHGLAATRGVVILLVWNAWILLEEAALLRVEGFPLWRRQTEVPHVVDELGRVEL